MICQIYQLLDSEEKLANSKIPHTGTCGDMQKLVQEQIWTRFVTADADAA